MLGADVGTTLVAQLLSLDISWLSPVLIFGGLIAFHAGRRKRVRDLGRLAIGLGLMLLALSLILADSAPLRESPVILTVVSALAGEPMLAILIAALLTWLAHSSLATVLLIASLTGAGAVPVDLIFPLVLGANIGGAIPPIVATLAATPTARRVTFGNAAFKLIGCLLVLPLIEPASELIALIDPDPVRQVVNFHTAFNLGLAVVFIFLTDTAARLAKRLVPDRPEIGRAHV